MEQNKMYGCASCFTILLTLQKQAGKKIKRVYNNGMFSVYR
ncbi:hypothetical protein SB48_HM08orf00340 [Heyndrickxia coagulans]|uniref:Uncharacterized protein n=1 Tax=Heyndrickxia coagulans TaxID=1398 RepID=A0AAN0WAD8_HEYCO|nr:hypothetical protein SB48_HM08orf00340 [Heyndrickxia coagulans]